MVSANSKGRLSKATDGSGSTTYAYDTHGRVTSKAQVTGATTLRMGYLYNVARYAGSFAEPRLRLPEGLSENCSEQGWLPVPQVRGSYR